MKKLAMSVRRTPLKHIVTGLMIFLGLAACTTTTVSAPERNGFVAILSGDLTAELSSGEMVSTDVTEPEDGFAILARSSDFETGLDFSVAFIFGGPIRAGSYQVTNPDTVTPQTVSVQLSTCTLETCSENWNSISEGMVTLSEVNETNIVGTFDLPLTLGEKKAVLKGTLYLLPLLPASSLK